MSLCCADVRRPAWYRLYRLKPALFTVRSEPEGLSHRNVYSVYEDGGQSSACASERVSWCPPWALDCVEPAQSGYIGHIEKATISQLKSRLSAYLKKVRAGHSILILDRDEPIARIERVAPDERPEDRLTRLERSSLLQRASAALSMEELRAPVPRPQRSVVEALVEERREGR